MFSFLKNSCSKCIFISNQLREFLLLYTEDELDLLNEEIADTRSAIKRLLKIGQEHSNDSGGSSRSTKEADLEGLKKYLSLLIANRDEINGCGGAFRMGRAF